MLDRFRTAGFELEGEPVEIRLPTQVHVSKSLKKAVNLNIYRNLHHHHLNKQKSNFHEEVKPLLRSLPSWEEIAIHYTIYAPTKQRLDTMNVGSVLDKYFSDTLVEAGKIPDDNYSHIRFVSFSFGGVSPRDGYATATIYPLKTKKETQMRIFMDESEVVAALVQSMTQKQMQDALTTFIKDTVGLNVTEVMITTDEEDGLSVEILAEAAGEAPKPKNKGGRPRGSKNKPKPAPKKEETPDVDGSGETGSGDDAAGGADASAADAADTGQEGKNGKDVPETDTPSDNDTADGDGETQTETEGKKRKNLFEDEDESSSSTSEKGDSSESSEADSAPAEKPVKRSSIFDA